jgi:hypothetical protein
MEKATGGWQSCGLSENPQDKVPGLSENPASLTSIGIDKNLAHRLEMVSNWPGAHAAKPPESTKKPARLAPVCACQHAPNPALKPARNRPYPLTLIQWLSEAKNAVLAALIQVRAVASCAFINRCRARRDRENPSHMLAWTFRYPSRVTIGPLALLAFVDEFCADVLDFDIRDSAAAAGEHGLPTMRVIGRAGKGKRRFLVLGLDVKNLFDCETERDLAFDGEVLQDFYSPVKVRIARS